jgi:hypothetical protein
MSSVFLFNKAIINVKIPRNVQIMLTPFYRINRHGAVRPPAEGG